MRTLFLMCAIFFLKNVLCIKTSPHIIVIIASDLGWNDVGFHGSNEIPTPNIDALAYNGVILNSHYTQSLDTPSLAAFLTGKYPIHTGMQHSVIMEAEPWGLSTNETILPEYLKQHGYATHAIGKWHLGFYKEKYTPTFRGFDTHFGFWQGFQDYYSHYAHATFSSEVGYDMRRNMKVDWDVMGKYTTELLTIEAEKLILEHDKTKPMFLYLVHLAAHTGNQDDPLQAPPEEIAKFANIADPNRRVYAAMVSMLDKSVGRVISALKEEDMLQNSIVLFLSHNGAQTEGSVHVNYGSNYPLRGLKNSPWEGGMRSVATVWSPFIKNPQRISNHLMHITDWLPTLYNAAGFNSSDLNTIDGKNMWNSISHIAASPRTDIIYNIDSIDNYTAIRVGDWKYITGTTNKGQFDNWYGSDPGQNGNYTYNKNIVLDSDSASALADLVSLLDIHTVQTGVKTKTGALRLVTPINKLSIDRIRNEATLICREVGPAEAIECTPLQSPCLFDISKDPCERINLASTHELILTNMEQYLHQLQTTVIKARNRPFDLNANPVFWNHTWTNWEDLNTNRIYWTPLVLCLISGAGIAFIIILIFFLNYYVKHYCDQTESPEMTPRESRYEKLTNEFKGLKEKVSKAFQSSKSNKEDLSENQPLVDQNDTVHDYNATDKERPLSENNFVSDEPAHKTEIENEHISGQNKPTSFTKGGRKR